MEDLRLKNLVVETLSNTACHGASNFIRSKSIFFKLMWLLAIISSLSACSFILIQTFIDYFQFDVVTKIRVIQENEPDFPMITFCEQEIFSTEYAWNYTKHILNKTDDQLSKMETKYLSTAIIQAIYDKENLTRFGFNFEIIVCGFNLIKCDINDFVWFFHPTLGFCFSFNSGRNQRNQSVPVKTIKTSGWYSGFSLMLQFPDRNQFGYYNVFNSKLQ
jgi:hypothetical protein